MAIMTQHGATIKEMEAAAVAWVAQLFGKPMFCVKAVTDIVDGDRPSQASTVCVLYHVYGVGKQCVVTWICYLQCMNLALHSSCLFTPCSAAGRISGEFGVGCSCTAGTTTTRTGVLRRQAAVRAVRET
jgi:Phosphorylase superfamily